MYVEFMKNCPPANSSDLLAFRLILDSWTQKRLIPISTHDVRLVDEKFSSRQFERPIGF